MMQTFLSFRSLNHSKKTFKRLTKLYFQKQNLLETKDKERLQETLSHLQNAIVEKDRRRAKLLADQLQALSNHLLPRSSFDKTKDFILSIGFALSVAIVIRQVWFEPYSIPTGSMRPTFKEGDYLFVSKTGYAINTPFRTGHFHFDENLLKRGSIVVFTGKNMDMSDDDTMYFGVIPGKKQYVKRLIAKPGDTLYFYGGELYGVDAKGNEIRELIDPTYFKNNEHIPFIRFDGKVDVINANTPKALPSVIIHQMGMPVAKLSLNQSGIITGEMLSKKEKNEIQNYSDLWGFKNYAMTRLLTEKQAREFFPEAMKGINPGLLYLEIHHHPSLQGSNLTQGGYEHIRPNLGKSVSLLALTQEHLDQILSHMTTSRFIVKNGKVFRFGSGFDNAQYRPTLPGVPDGTYEFQDGKLQEVLFGSITKALPQNHPLMKHTPENIQTLYNFGFEWANYYAPSKNGPMPSRYAYFRNGDFYLMGGIILKKDDPYLTTFLKSEYEKKAISTTQRPYHPFEDTKPPLSQDGNFDVDFIRKYGLTIPENMYLVLGDNHAMSADSRMFGFVPQENLRGTVSQLLWPIGERWGSLPQAVNHYLTLPNLIIWSLAALVGILSYMYQTRKYFRPFKF